MTVEMLVDYPYNGKIYKVGNLLTADAGTEAGLIAAKMADANTAGATAYVEIVPQTQYTPVLASTNPLTGGIGSLWAASVNILPQLLLSLYSLPATVTTALNSTEQVLAQIAIPPGLAVDRSKLELLINLSKIGGVSDTATIKLYVGKLGNTSDAVMVSVALSTTLITWQYRTGILLYTDGFRQAGLNTGVNPTPGASTSAMAAKQTAAGLLDGICYITLTAKMTTGAVEQVELVNLDASLKV